MIISFLKIVYRNIIRRKIFALINIFGLAFGITACLVIYLYVSYENSYEKFNVNADCTPTSQQSGEQVAISIFYALGEK